MYRRFQNPIMQGTAVMPNAMQAPPVVRIAGVQEGSLAAAVLTQQHAPWINGFIRAQRQGQEIGGLNDVHVMRDTPDFRIVYSRQFGQEYIAVRFRPEAVSRAERPETITFDHLLLGTVSVSVSVAGLSAGALHPDSGDPAELSFSGTVAIGDATHSATLTASFNKSVTLIAYIFGSYEELRYLPPDPPDPAAEGFLIPNPGTPYAVTVGGLDAMFDRQPTDATTVSSTYTGPYSYPDTLYTDATSTKYVKTRASAIGVDLASAIRVTAQASQTGRRELTGGDTSDPNSWPIRAAVSASFYPRGVGSYRYFVRTWRGFSTDAESRFTHISPVAYAGAWDPNVRGFSTSISTSFDIDVSSAVTDFSVTVPAGA